jgi:hypothetical protein
MFSRRSALLAIHGCEVGPKSPFDQELVRPKARGAFGIVTILRFGWLIHKKFGSSRFLPSID